MSLFLLLTGSIFILHTTELLLTIAGALLSGYLLKLLLDKFWFNSKKDETDELETELVTLQGRFSAEMIKKEAVSKLLQEDVKAAEKKNFDLQIQYAKALNHIEKIKINWHGDDDEIQFDTDDAGNRILLNLQEKIPTMPVETFLRQLRIKIIRSGL